MSSVIFDGIRSPFGRHSGALASIRPDDLAATLIKELVRRNNLSGLEIEDVVLGNSNQAGEDSRNLARHAALLAGLPVEVAGITINRLCGSGLAALADADRMAQCGQGEIFVTGGSEVMSRAPWVIAKAKSAFSRSNPVEDSTLGARFPNPLLTAEYGNPNMVTTADNVAKDLSISRQDSDQFALNSQNRYAGALASGFFEQELFAVDVPAKKKKLRSDKVDLDEHPRADTSLDKLSQLQPINKDGVVTAGNASGINDGAAVLLVGTENVGQKLDLKPRARILTTAVAGVPPRIMGLGPVPASKKALERVGLDMTQMDVIEINEAFAPQVLGCLKQMGISFDDSRVNPNGGAIALGHPLGASGARLALTAVRQLEAINGRYALVCMCIGVGQGIAVILERAEN
tara:strand:- start:29731 stop:30939 length:1209 start_codon:yes stop_codon:yes gene_type:complete